MAKSRFQKFVDKYITDAEFRKEFSRSRIKAVESLGYEITPEIKAALKALDLKSLKALAISLEGPAATC